NSFTAKGLSKLFLQQIVDAVNDEVHDFNRGVDDTKAFSHAWEGVTEELVVKLDNDFLFSGCAVDAFSSHTNAGVELIKRVGFFIQAVLIQNIQNVLHGL